MIKVESRKIVIEGRIVIFQEVLDLICEAATSEDEACPHELTEMILDAIEKRALGFEKGRILFKDEIL